MLENSLKNVSPKKKAMTMITVQINHRLREISNKKINKVQEPIRRIIKKLLNPSNKKNEVKLKDISFSVAGYISSKNYNHNFEIEISLPFSNEIARKLHKLKQGLTREIKELNIIPVKKLTGEKSFVHFSLKKAPGTGFR